MVKHTYDGEEPLPEGEEVAPRGTRLMGRVRWIILGVLSLFAVVMLLGFFGLLPWSQEGPADQQYHCPMHPTYVSNHPGDCPICGMSLVPVPTEAGDSTLPEAPPASGDSASVHAAQPGQYTCPMDPDVISDAPGRCPKCGMFLEPVAASSADAPSGGVDGLVAVTIAPERLQLIGVRMGVATMRPLDGSLRLLGFVAPDATRLTHVNIRFSGWIREVAVEAGQSVKEGQSILSVYSQELFQAEQEYLLSKQSLQAATDSQLRDSRRRLFDASRQRLELLGIPAEERLRLETEGQPRAESWIVSPASGVVLEKNVVPGQSVGPDQALLVVADLSRVWVLADVYERDLAYIREGQTVQLRTSAYPGQAFDGTVRQILPAVSQETRTLKVRIEFANDGRLKPGQYGEIELAGSGANVLTVPQEAVVDEGHRQYVFVVHEGTHFEPRRVVLGRRTDDYVEVLSGVSEGDEVVTSANFLIDAESRLKAALTGMSPHGGHSGENGKTDSGQVP